MTKSTPRFRDHEIVQPQDSPYGSGSGSRPDLEALYEMARQVTRSGRQAVEASRQLRTVVRARHGNSEPPQQSVDADRR